MQRTLSYSAIAALAIASASASAQLRVSELFFDSPGSDYPNEYVEIRGLPNTNLDNHYLVFIESEGRADATGASGQIDNIFDLSGRQLGTNGFLIFRMNGAQHTGIAPGTNDLRNTVDFGFGGSSSTIGHVNSGNTGAIENGGTTAFLVRSSQAITPASFIDLDLDTNNDGTFDTGMSYAAPGPKIMYQNGGVSWEVLDSIGQFEVGEAANGRGYAQVNFSAGPMTGANLTPGAINVNTGQIDAVRESNPLGGIEPEYIGRWAGSTGNAADDFVVANVTDNPASGYTAANRWADGYRVSGNHAQQSRGEFFRGFQDEAAAYGTRFQNTLGRPNYPVRDGDLNENLRIDQGDLDIILANWDQTDPTQLGYWGFGDANGDALINRADLDNVMDVWPLPTDATFELADMGILAGDADLSGEVDFNDLVTLARNYNQPLRGYRNGDFDHNSFVDFNDLVALARRYGRGWFDSEAGLAFGPQEFALLRSIGVSVPEPTSMFALFGLSILAMRRR